MPSPVCLRSAGSPQGPPRWPAVSGPSPGSRGRRARRRLDRRASALLSGRGLLREQAQFCNCISANGPQPSPFPGTRARPLTTLPCCSRSAPPLHPQASPGRCAPLSAGTVAENTKQGLPTTKGPGPHVPVIVRALAAPGGAAHAGASVRSGLRGSAPQSPPATPAHAALSSAVGHTRLSILRCCRRFSPVTPISSRDSPGEGEGLSCAAGRVG